MEEKLTRKKTLNIIISAFLTFFMIGLGQIACGRIRRGIMLYVLSLLLFMAAAFIAIQPFPLFNILAAGVIFISVFLFAIIDSILIAKNPDNSLKLKPLVGYLLLVIILILNSSFIGPVIVKTIKDNYVQAFKIPSGAMEPTLLVGDQILTSKFQYKSHEPKRGDVIIFDYPKDPSRNFIMRAIGVGGDIIEIKDKQLYVNGNKIEEHFIQHLGPTNKQAEMLDKLIDFGPVTVPQDSIFAMGDNRDRSYDSRFWGFVKRSEVKGKAGTIYWSWDKNISKVRWDRIGKVIS